MRFFDQFSLAFGNLRRHKLRSFLTISAVVIGAMSVIVMLTLVLGAKRAMLKQIKSMDALTLATVTGDPNISGGDVFRTNGDGDSTGAKMTDATVRQLSAIPHVVAAAPIVNVYVRSFQLEGAQKRMQPNLMSYSPRAHVFTIPLAAGRALQENDGASVVLSSRALKFFGYSGNAAGIVGKNILFGMDGSQYYNDATGNPPSPPQNASRDYYDKQNQTLRTIPVRVVGVAAGGASDDTNYISYGFARKLMTQRRWEFDQAKQDAQRRAAEQSHSRYEQTSPNAFMKIVRDDSVLRQGFGAIMLRVDTTDHVATVAAAVEHMGLGVTTAQAMLDSISKLFMILGLIAGAIGGISLFVAAIGIINTMVMATLERTREIGVMRACGATRATILRMFSLEAAMIGFFGGVCALVGSFTLGKIANVVFNKLATSNSLPISDVIAFPAWLVAGVLAMTAFVGFAAGIYPAMRAARMDPVAALRYE